MVAVSLMGTSIFSDPELPVQEKWICLKGFLFFSFFNSGAVSGQSP